MLGFMVDTCRSELGCVNCVQLMFQGETLFHLHFNPSSTLITYFVKISSNIFLRACPVQDAELYVEGIQSYKAQFLLSKGTDSLEKQY